MTAESTGRLKKSNAAAFDNFLMTKYERMIRATRTRSYPYALTIDPSTICQLRCPGCMTGLTNEWRRKKKSGGKNLGRPLERLSRGVVDSILDECGDVMFFCHFYNWSEPLLHDELPDFIRAASARDAYTKVDSNLSLRLSDDKIRDILTSGLSELAASIDGFSQKTYERYRRGGRFELAFENVTRLAAMRDALGVETRITWNFLLFNFNEHEADDIAAYCEQHNIQFNPRDAILVGPMVDWAPSYKREGKPNPWREQVRAAERQPARWKSPAGVIPLVMGRPEGRSCGWHYGFTTVNGDAGVLPCCGLFEKRADFGVVTEAPGSFGEVWNNANFETARRTYPETTTVVEEFPVSVCSKCTRTEAFRDHYAILDRDIVRTYWSHPEGSEVRQFDEYFKLLQKKPAEFVAAYARRYNGEVARESEPAIHRSRGVHAPGELPASGGSELASGSLS